MNHSFAVNYLNFIEDAYLRNKTSIRFISVNTSTEDSLMNHTLIGGERSFC